MERWWWWGWGGGGLPGEESGGGRGLRGRAEDAVDAVGETRLQVRDAADVGRHLLGERRRSVSVVHRFFLLKKKAVAVVVSVPRIVFKASRTVDTRSFDR